MSRSGSDLSREGRALLDAVDALGITLPRRVSVSVVRGAFERERALAPAGLEVARVVDALAEGDESEVLVRVYIPRGTPPFRVMVFMHGGGWVAGSIEHSDSDARNLCARTGSIVVAPEYRLAPEHPFPAAVMDAYAAASWCATTAGDLGGDPTRLIVIGDSAGGNLAASVARLAAERGQPRVALQVLIYPALNYAFDTPTYEAFSEGYWLTRSDMAFFWDQYLANPKDLADPLACPLRVAPSRGTAPAMIVTAECDVLRAEAEQYARLLTRAGVYTTLRCYEGLPHGFWSCGAVIAAPARLNTEIAEFIDGWGL